LGAQQPSFFSRVPLEFNRPIGPKFRGDEGAVGFQYGDGAGAVVISAYDKDINRLSQVQENFKRLAWSRQERPHVGTAAENGDYDKDQLYC
jgi:3-oxoacyl-[acyl-carrier-protein] synthase III